ncbi:hydantoinase/oxoprolinase family protein [Roseovarius sp. EGI FJ00037]|uniref:hydantoinase/oxoprolinase family protein n=2 Tax=Roseovarius TaxID=74030 RepID=UPI0022A75459|nr:hydantoinase/oxoprolinase family protein [Roseovarius sp. EGI FJ00037]MCZ0811609.1 hydantoinase/oxoprolinase family protein [Roseovarius sp. EGI FJ00037]
MDGSMRAADWKIGVDIGGTFMDFCALDTRSGQIASLKVLTTPDDPGAELLTGLDLLAARDGLDPASVTRFVHGTTVGINTILQRKGARLALITNAGFEDVIELARLRMPKMYSLFCHRADPLIPRDRIFGINARMRADGSTPVAPALDDVRAAIDRARTAGAEGIIVSLLHSWRDGTQEAAVRAMIETEAPDLFTFTSSEVWPVIREYERSSTAILNGYVHPRVAGYLAALEDRLAARNVPAHALLTKSNGGLMSAGEGRRDCVSMLLSGTASGVMGAAWLARQAGEKRVLTLDIGGTSADFALIVDGAVQFGTDERIGDFPLHIPSVSVSSIAIGGGSIASVDSMGVLRVGPESAGSTPGPACYGRGGLDPTVTDAMAVCGWLGQAEMAYGQLSIDPALARASVSRLATPLGRGIEETAQAIIDIAVSELFVEVEKLSSRSGVDLRDFALMPFGGGGPMLGAFLARELGMSRVLAPRRPGVVSALGGLVADLRGDFLRTIFTELDAGAPTRLAAAFKALSREGAAWLAAQGHDGPAQIRLSADMRYAGQSYEIDTALEPAWLAEPARIAAAFHDTHRRIYDFDDPDGRIEIINLRLSAIGVTPKPDLAEAAPEAGAPATPARQVRVHLDGARDLPLYERAGLLAGARFDGPAVVCQEDTTLAIPDGARAHVDTHLNIHLDFAE